MQLRKLTDEGINRFENLLKLRASDTILDERMDLLQDLSFSSPVDDSIHLDEHQVFEVREDAGVYLYKKLGHKTETDLKNKYLWAWLTLFFFSQVCRGKMQKGLQFYVPDFSKHSRYYKHFLWGPFSICQQHHEHLDKVRAVLCSSVSQGNDVIEQIASRQDLVACPNVLEATTKLYVDPATKSLKDGFTSKKHGGDVRRFGNVLMQFDLTYDLYQISADDLIRMLPQEFDRFKSQELL